MTKPFAFLHERGPLLLAVMVVLLFVTDMGYGMALKQHERIHEPLYRVRQSLVIALSRFHDENPGGYLGLKDVERLFIQNGFAQFRSDEELKKWRNETLLDTQALNALFVKAAEMPIEHPEDYSLIQANGKGVVDFYYLAFALFGLEVSSPYYFYFLLLGLSLGLTLWHFSRNLFVMLAVALYLAALHLAIGHIAPAYPGLGVIYNSRIFDIAVIPPALFLVAACMTKASFSRAMLVATIIQSALLWFFIWARLSVVWAPLGVLLLPLGVLLLRAIKLFKTFQPYALRDFWPAAALAAVLLAGYVIFAQIAIDKRYAGDKAHLFWHAVYFGILEAPYSRMGDAGVYYSAAEYFEAKGIEMVRLGEDYVRYEAMVREAFLHHVSERPLEFIQKFINKITYLLRSNNVLFQQTGFFSAKAHGIGLIIALFGAVLWRARYTATQFRRQGVLFICLGTPALLFSMAPVLATTVGISAANGYMICVFIWCYYFLALALAAPLFLLGRKNNI